jgi:acetyltransferase-like isoleucine patch superfamily enzyme
MEFPSKIFRFFFYQLESLCSFFRLFKLKLLYPGVTIDLKSRIERNCSIKCIKGGRLTILKSHISAGTNIIADIGSTLSIYNSFIGRNCVIVAKEKIIINKNCLVAEMVVIRDQDHITEIYAKGKTREEFNIEPIEIKNNVWIASKATILKGVSIGDHSVVAASAVVINDIPSFEVWGGVPAKFIKKLLINSET